MYALEHIFDASNLLDLSEPLPDEIDGQDQMLDAKTEDRVCPAPARHLEKAVFGAP
jgi:hypothetical protein